MCSSFGPGWLIERLADFYDAYPEIDLQLKLYAQDPLISGEVADAFVTANPVKPDYVSVRLKDEILLAVHKPSAKRVKRHRLITTWLDKGQIGQEWADYCKAAGLKLSEFQDGAFRQCTHYLFALEMAKSGLGVALVPDFLAARDIAAGTVTAFGRRLVPSGVPTGCATRRAARMSPSLLPCATGYCPGWRRNRAGGADSWRSRTWQSRSGKVMNITRRRFHEILPWLRGVWGPDRPGLAQLVTKYAEDLRNGEFNWFPSARPAGRC